MQEVQCRCSLDDEGEGADRKTNGPVYRPWCGDSDVRDVTRPLHGSQFADAVHAVHNFPAVGACASLASRESESVQRNLGKDTATGNGTTPKRDVVNG